MAKTCERCGVEKATYKRQGLDKFGNMCECNLCERCYFETSAQGWTTTKTRGVIAWQKSSGQCAFCGAIGEVSQMSYKDPSGATKIYSACDSCRRTVGDGNNYAAVDNSNKKEETNWTKVLRGIGIAAAILSTIIGGYIGVVIFNLLDADGFFGFLIGAIVGLLVGVVAIAFTMVICEISDTLKANNRELKKIYIELSKR